MVEVEKKLSVISHTDQLRSIWEEKPQCISCGYLGYPKIQPVVPPNHNVFLQQTFFVVSLINAVTQFVVLLTDVITPFVVPLISAVTQFVVLLTNVITPFVVTLISAVTQFVVSLAKF